MPPTHCTPALQGQHLRDRVKTKNLCSRMNPQLEVREVLQWLKQPLCTSQSPNEGGCTDLFVAFSAAGLYFLMMTVCHLH